MTSLAQKIERSITSQNDSCELGNALAEINELSRLIPPERLHTLSDRIDLFVDHPERAFVIEMANPVAAGAAKGEFLFKLSPLFAELLTALRALK